MTKANFPNSAEENVENDSLLSVASKSSFRCQFCGLFDERFSSENELDFHYWKDCPMLTCCLKCEQTIEISYLNEHVLVECKCRQNHGKCPRCGEAISKRLEKICPLGIGLVKRMITSPIGDA